MKALLIAALVLATREAPSAPASDVSRVLAANHAAVGDLPASGAARFEYRKTDSGLTGRMVDRFDLATGAYVETEDKSGLSEATGYDGRIPWWRDISGANTPQMGGDRIAMAVNCAYRFINLWWRDDRGGATITYAGRERAGGRALEHLVVTPKGGKRFDAWFDADSHLLIRILEDEQFLHVTESYDDYRREGGVVLAHRVRRDPGLGAAGLETATLEHVSFRPAAPLSAYALPDTPLTGASITDGAASTTVPFRLLNNHIYLQASVNGRGPYTFMVDTGGHTLLSPHLIAETGLKPIGESVATGSGEGHSVSGFVHFDEIAIGGARLRDQMGIATEIYDPAIEGIRVDGMVGFELVRRLVTQIDYGGRTITFTDPARFQPKDLGEAVPFLFYNHLPNVAGFIGSRPARFDIDTGSRTEIDLTSPFVAAHQLRAEFTRGASVVTGWGVGGPSRSYIVRLPSLKLGSVAVDHIAAGLSQDRGGAMSDPNYDGNLGSGLLKRFVVTFDYAHQVMYLKRLTPAPADAGSFDRSGLWINAKSGGYTVTDVARDSAAAAAGIRIGDVITSIDGQPARDEALSDARLKLRVQPAGTKVELIVRRGSESRLIAVTLRDQI